MFKNRRPMWRAGLLTLGILASAGVLVIAPASPAHADPTCQDVLLVTARGSNAPLNPWSNEVERFNNTVQPLLSDLRTAVVQLGDEDGDGGMANGTVPNGLGWSGVDSGEYPAVPVDWFSSGPLTDYFNSVGVGVSGLVSYLTSRIASCPQEAIVLGGYSQGAEVVGQALQSIGQASRNHIGFVALYGDPRYNPACDQARWWVRGNAYLCNGGIIGARSPYLPSDLEGRAGSWCDAGDGVCSGSSIACSPGPPPCTHGDAYRNYWIAQSVAEVANAARAKQRELNHYRIGHLAGNGTFWIKEGGVGANWTLVGENVSAFRLSPNRIGILQGGVLSVKEGLLSSGWSTVATNVVSFAITDNRIGVLDAAGNLSVKEGGVGANWNWIGTNVSSFELSPNRVGALFGTSLYVKEGSLLGNWNPIATNVTTYRLTDTRIGALFGTDLYVKEGTLGAPWNLVINPTTNFLFSNNRILAQQTNGDLYVKEGPLGATWWGVSGSVDGFAISDSRVMRWTGGTLSVKDGPIDGPWTVVTTVTVAGGLSK